MGRKRRGSREEGRKEEGRKEGEGRKGEEGRNSVYCILLPVGVPVLLNEEQTNRLTDQVTN